MQINKFINNNFNFHAREFSFNTPTNTIDTQSAFQNFFLFVFILRKKKMKNIDSKDDEKKIRIRKTAI